MSELLQEEPVLSAQSKLKLTRNAKGFIQFEITVVEGFDPAELDRIREAAVAQAAALAREFPDAG